jgi:hypothetical protein
LLEAGKTQDLPSKIWQTVKPNKVEVLEKKFNFLLNILPPPPPPNHQILATPLQKTTQYFVAENYDFLSRPKAEIFGLLNACNIEADGWVHGKKVVVFCNNVSK